MAAPKMKPGQVYPDLRIARFIGAERYLTKSGKVGTMGAIESKRRWDQENKERKAETDRLWYQKNKERKAETDRLWYQENKERRAAVSRLWKQENKERVAETARLWYQENKERVTETIRQWKQDNQDKVSAHSANHRALKRSAIPNGVSKKEVSKQWARMTRWAKRLEATLGIPCHVDHIIALANGGAHAPTNFQVCTMPDNCAKSDSWEFVDYRHPRILHPDAAELYRHSGFLGIGEVWTIEDLKAPRK